MQKGLLKIFPVFLLIFVVFSACTLYESPTSFKHRSGIYFDFPNGWSRLTKKEWRDMDLGPNKTLITIMDKNREAGFSLIPLDLDNNTKITLNMLGSDAAAKGAMFVESINAAGPGKYQQYKLFKKDGSSFAGYPMAEIVFQGRNPGKTLKWYRILALIGPDSNNPILMFVFTAPINKKDSFKKDFDFIEDSWRWTNKR